MKRRVRKIANFFTFNLLFFALYLNFIHKDQNTLSVTDHAGQPRVAAFSETATASSQPVQVPVQQEQTKSDNTPLKLSIN
jgi:hypothetical protein